MDDTIKPTNLMPDEIIPSGFTPSELTPDAMSKIDTKIAIIIGTIAALIAISILAALFVQNRREYLRDRRKNSIQKNNLTNTELNDEIDKYQKQIYYCCSVDFPDQKDLEYINKRRIESFDNEKYKLKANNNLNINLQQYQVIFCEDSFEKSTNQFNKIKQLRDKNNPEVNKILLTILKSQFMTQNLFELYSRGDPHGSLNADRQNEYIQNTNYHKIQSNLVKKYQEKIIKLLNDRNFNEANNIVKIFKMLGYYNGEMLGVLQYQSIQKNERIGMTIQQNKILDSPNFIKQFQKILKDEYVYSLFDLRFEYEEKILNILPKNGERLSPNNQNKYNDYMKIYNDLKIVIENIIQSNPEYANLKDLTKEEFQKEDNKNFEQTLKFIDKNEIVERMNEMMNPLKNPPGNNVNLGRGGMGQEH